VKAGEGFSEIKQNNRQNFCLFIDLIYLMFYLSLFDVQTAKRLLLPF
jgi:hypothetical protein